MVLKSSTIIVLLSLFPIMSQYLLYMFSVPILGALIQSTFEQNPQNLYKISKEGKNNRAHYVSE